GRGYYGRTRDAAQGEERRSPKRVRGQTVWRWQAGLCLSQGAVVSWAHPNWTVASTASLDSQTPAGSPSLTAVSWAVEWRPSLQQSLVTDKFTESVYVLANEPSVALYRLQEHVRRSLPELAQHKADMQRWEEQSQGAIYTVEYACSAVKNLVDSSVYFRSVEGLLKQAISIRDHMNATAQGHR
uniref:BLOC-1 related complex subunit 8 n=1 Tax=Bos taurus TaxID=9913 RepID=A0ABI0P301_BOVIN